jgi:hypothetical protein
VPPLWGGPPGEFTTSPDDAEPLPYDAEIVTVVSVDTGLVVTPKFAVDDPAETVTLAGTVATEVLLQERVTTAPPEGAAPVRKTPPCDELPPVNELGFRITLDTLTGGGGGVAVS